MRPSKQRAAGLERWRGCERRMKVLIHMLGTLVRNLLSVLWVILQCHMRLEDPELYLDAQLDLIHWRWHFCFLTYGNVNWNDIQDSRTFCLSPLCYCRQLPRGKWKVGMTGISSESGIRAHRTGSSTVHSLLLAHCTTLHSTTTNSIAVWVLFHSCT